MGMIVVAAWLGLAAFFLLTVAVTLARYRPLGAPSSRPLPRCSIIMPIKGATNFLDSNLAALARLQPFDGEILLAVEREEDPAYAIAAPIVAANRDRMKMLVGIATEYENPKLRNVAKAYAASREDVILFLDDSVEIERDLVIDLLAALEPGVAAVTAAPLGHDVENFAAAVEAASFNGYLFRLETFLELFGAAAAFGNALAFRKRDLEAAGGFRRLTEGPCEDNALSKALRGGGGRIRLLRTGVRRRIGRRSWTEVYLRNLRWKNCTKCHDFAAFLVEPLIGGLVFNVLGAVAVATLLGSPLWIGLAVSMVAWYGTEAVLHLACGWRVGPSTPFAWIGRDVLHPTFMVLALFSDEVDWRGERIRMGFGRRARPKP